MLFKNSFIQIAGVKNHREAQMLVSCGVDYIGFPLRLDYHQEDLREDEAAAIIRKLPMSTQAVLITYLDKAEDIIELCGKLDAKIIQLHGDISCDNLKQIKNRYPALQIIKSLIIGKIPEQIIMKNMQSYTEWVDAFLLDTFDPISGASGATGKIHDWGISRKLVEMSNCPIILAGGLTADNVRQAILTVKPAGVDVHTGVENRIGCKDRQLVEKFIAEARKAFGIIERQY
jgi:phosphoribosylanthranilate isomerase